MKTEHAPQVVPAHCLRDPNVRCKAAGIGRRNPLGSDKLPPLSVAAVLSVIDPQHEDAVIGEKVFVDGLGKREAMHDGTERRLVLHRRHFQVLLASRFHHSSGEVARRGSHEHPFACGNTGLVQDRRELARHWTDTAVRLVRDGQIKAETCAFESLGDDWGRLVG